MKYLLFTILILLNFSCQNPDGNKLDSLVQSKLNERKEKYFKEKLDVCRRNLMSISQSKVDSILKMESKKSKFDSISVPYDTFRPIKPEISFPKFNKPNRPKGDTLLPPGQQFN
ncbi:MAG: hypothetical protein IPP06_02670 [Saprospiraceae bacterium]|nr:hypothetical protein [Candidatus Vicinibacter affinis]